MVKTSRSILRGSFHLRITRTRTGDRARTVDHRRATSNIRDTGSRIILIRGDTRVHSLFGSPVAHSLSPLIFNTTFQKLSLNRTYIPFEVTKERLGQALEAADTLGFDGFNVTMPLKTTIPEMLDDLDKTAKETGTVNTVTRTANGLVGYNTDGEGAMRALESYSFDPVGRHILVIGSGGAAQALVHKLATRKNRIRVLNRTINNARKLVENVPGQSEISYEQLNRQSFQKSLQGIDLLVNATPVKTRSLMLQFSVSADRLKDVKWVFDLSYDRPEDPMPLSINVVSPLEMLLHQAALSYEIWLKEKAPLNVMRASLVNYLGKDWK